MTIVAGLVLMPPPYMIVNATNELSVEWISLGILFCVHLDMGDNETEFTYGTNDYCQKKW